MKLQVIFEYLDKATAPMKRTEKQTANLLNSFKRLQNCMFKINQTADLLGRMGDTLGQLMQPGVAFEQSMADLSSITGIIGKDLERLGEVARRTGVSSGLGASGAADAFALLASQIDVSKIGMDGLIELQGRTITLAQASGMSMTDAANSMAGTINQFGLQASEAGRIINVLAAGSKYGAAEIPQLAESFKVVGAACNAAGLSVESTAGAIEVLSKNNLKGAEAGTALRNIVLKMQTAMGVDFSQTSLQEALVKLKPHLKDATYMSKLFGMENVAAAQFLVANSDMVKEMTDRVTGTNVATEQAAIRTATWSQRIKEQTAKFNDWGISLQKQFGGVMNFIQVAGQGSSMLMTLAPVGKMFTGIGKGAWGAGIGIVRFGKTLRLLSLAKSTRSAAVFARAVQMAGMSGKIAGGGLAIYNSVVAAGTALMSKAFWMQMYKVTATKLHTIWTLLSAKALGVAALATAGWGKATMLATAIQGGLTKAFRLARTVMTTTVIPTLWGVIAATWAWTAALLANPITWIVLAIAGLVAAIVVCWQKFAGFRAVVMTVWDTVSGFGEALYNWLVAPLEAAWKMAKGIGKAIGVLFKGGSWSDAGDEVGKGFKEGVDAGTTRMKKAIQGVKDTATGIEGNYSMHLTEERAKQAEKEKETKGRKASKKEEVKIDPIVLQAAAVPDVLSQPINPAMNVQEPNLIGKLGGLDLKMPDGENSPDVKITEARPVNIPRFEKSSQQTPSYPGHPAQAPPEAGSLSQVPASPRLPEISTVRPVQMDMSFLARNVNNITDSVSNNQQTINTSTQTAPTRIEVNFQPVINLSADVTQKGKDDLLSVFRKFVPELTRMVEEEQRRNGRGVYAIS